MEFLESMKPLYAVSAFQGYSKDEIQFMKRQFGRIPKVLEDYYRMAGKTEAFLCVQDTWITPAHYQKWPFLQSCRHLILLNENQGVCRAGLRPEDLALANPPVYISENDTDWVLCSPALDEFLAAALTYESMFTFAYNPANFYWFTESEMEIVRHRLTKLPFELPGWLQQKITFYHNAPDNLAVVMEGCETIAEYDLQVKLFQAYYGAASEASYRKLSEAMDGLGEIV